MVPVQNGPVPWPFDTGWISRLHNMTPTHRVIVLSFFDGVGTAFIALENLCGPPALAMAWEIDPGCIEVTQTRFPYIVHRGDINQDSPAAVSEMIRKHDPHQTCVILLLAAPPCPDFSGITGNGQGFEGERVANSRRSCNFHNNWRPNWMVGNVITSSRMWSCNRRRKYNGCQITPIVPQWWLTQQTLDGYPDRDCGGARSTGQP